MSLRRCVKWDLCFSTNSCNSEEASIQRIPPPVIITGLRSSQNIYFSSIISDEVRGARESSPEMDQRFLHYFFV